VDEQFRQRFAHIVITARGHLNQREFGEQIDVSQSTVVGWERGNTIPNLENLAKLATLRGQLPEELLAELYGRACGAELSMEDRVRLMTKDQLIDLLGILSDQLRSRKF
jgi:transcriptional regulator with XRE-family HTH domain